MNHFEKSLIADVILNSVKLTDTVFTKNSIAKTISATSQLIQSLLLFTFVHTMSFPL